MLRQRRSTSVLRAIRGLRKREAGGSTCRFVARRATGSRAAAGRPLAGSRTRSHPTAAQPFAFTSCPVPSMARRIPTSRRFLASRPPSVWRRRAVESGRRVADTGRVHHRRPDARRLLPAVRSPAHRRTAAAVRRRRVLPRRLPGPRDHRDRAGARLHDVGAIPRAHRNRDEQPGREHRGCAADRRPGNRRLAIPVSGNDPHRLDEGQQPEMRFLSVARKDRGAILPIGRSKGPVFWYSANGTFTTSTYYADSLPPWVVAFNARKLPHPTRASRGRHCCRHANTWSPTACPSSEWRRLRVSAPGAAAPAEAAAAAAEVPVDG